MKPENAARAVARAMGWAGARGGWIYDANRRPLAAGWHALADRLEARRWIVDRGPGRGFEVDWPRVPAPGAVRPRADATLEPHPSGPRHPDGDGPQPTRRFPLTIRAARDRWTLVPVIDCESLPLAEAALATIAAVQAAQLAGADPTTQHDDPAEARKLARETAAATGIQWVAARTTTARPEIDSQPVDRRRN